MGIALSLLAAPAAWSQGESESVAAIAKLGGKVEVDQDSAGKPVVKVNFKNKTLQTLIEIEV